MVEFVPGLLVEKGRLEKVEVRDLGKSEDGTYVNELAVVVFTHKTLYNSSIKERKVGSGATPRKGLDTQALAQIRSEYILSIFSVLYVLYYLSNLSYCFCRLS